MLMCYMAGNGKEIGLGTADLLEALNAEEAQKDFLGEIRRIRGVSQTGRKKATQSLAVFCSDVGDEVLLGLGKQVGSGGLLLVH
jgi:hypothetical protein